MTNIGVLAGHRDRCCAVGARHVSREPAWRTFVHWRQTAPAVPLKTSSPPFELRAPRMLFAHLRRRARPGAARPACRRLRISSMRWSAPERTTRGQASATRDQSRARARSDQGSESIRCALPDYACGGHVPTRGRIGLRPMPPTSRAIDHPLQVGEAATEPAVDRRQRDLHDVDVDEQHERRAADRDQRPPAWSMPFRHRRAVRSWSAGFSFGVLSTVIVAPRRRVLLPWRSCGLPRARHRPGGRSAG